jgi:D-ribose pyranase
MLNSSILNTQLISLLCGLGHTQTICVCDAGLPIPRHIPCIDLALTKGIPDIYTVLDLINANLVIEAGVAASECLNNNPRFNSYITKTPYPVTYISHEEFKKASLSSTAFVRTGECTPYANIVLTAGVSF